jgi:hypothetical protein
MWYQAHSARFMMNELMGYSETAPDEQIDPRVYVIFQPNIQGRYVACERWGSSQNAMIDIDFPDPDDNKKVKDWDYDELIDPMFSMYNKMTYYNFDLKFPTVSPSEVHLLLAEAGIRFPNLGINVTEAYRKAINTSIDWYYDLNNNNKYHETSQPGIPKNVMPGSQYPKPSATVINDFLTYKSGLFNAMSDNEKKREIFYQKFTHLNYLNAMEVWSEARRLHKELGLLAPKAECVVWMERFFYPVSEAQTNPDNFGKVAAKNDAVTPVWWTGR